MSATRRFPTSGDRKSEHSGNVYLASEISVICQHLYSVNILTSLRRSDMMTYLIMETYVGYTSISNVGRSEKWTLGKRVFGVGDFSDLLASLFSEHIDISKTFRPDDISNHENVCRLHVDFQRRLIGKVNTRETCSWRRIFQWFVSIVI